MKTTISIFFIMSAMLLEGQEIISIDQKSSAPKYYGQVKLVSGFSSPNNSRVDVFCSGGFKSVSIPNNYVGFQDKYSNYSNYIGLATYNGKSSFTLKESIEYGESNVQKSDLSFLQVKLPINLIKGKEYELQYYISLAENSGFATSGWGVYFSNIQYSDSANYSSFVIAQYASDTLILDKEHWVPLKFRFISTGDEKYMTIGCFKNEYKIFEVGSGLGYAKNKAYYFLSDITIFKIPEDTDKDGVIDINDKCPSVFGLKKLNGCPDMDNDSIPDNIDFCPEVFGLKKFNGCPDTDGDGVEDRYDRCPSQKGNVNNFGCPDSLAITELLSKLFKELDFVGDEINSTSSSFSILDKIIQVQKFNSGYIFVIQLDKFNSFTDSTYGSIRLKKIIEYIVSKGCDINSIKIEGINKTKSDDENNRRIEHEIQN